VLGFDSAVPATPELWDAVESLLGTPALVRVTYLDRYAGGPPEVALAHLRGGALIGCANGADGATVRGTAGAGHAFGVAAAARWKALGAPAGTGIALDVEAAWSPSPDFLAGYTDGVAGALYRPLLYGSLRAPGTVSALSAAAARYTAVRDHLLLWSATPAVGWAGKAPAWGPDGGPLPVVGWQFAENVSTPPGPVDLDLWTDGAPLWHAGPDVAAAQAALSQAEAAVLRARAALGGA
jgi:hypothetical protein